MNSIQGKGKRQKASQSKSATRKSPQSSVGPRRQKLRNAVAKYTAARVSKGGTLAFGGSQFSSNVQTVPAAFNNIIGNSTFSKVVGTVKHPKLGIEGITIIGCQPFADVATDGTTSNLFTATTLATQANANVYRVSTDTLNGPCAAQANLHQKYVIRDMLWEFNTNVASTQAGSFAMCIVTDGADAVGPSSFSEVRQVTPSIVIPFRADKAYLHYHYDGDDTYFTLLDSTSTASRRQTCQLSFVGFPSASSIGAVTQGYINVYYIIELYQPTQSNGFTFRATSRMEREYLLKCQEEFRQLQASEAGEGEMCHIDCKEISTVKSQTGRFFR